MGQNTSTSASLQEELMKKRIRQTMGTFSDLGVHIKQANEWAKLSPTPKTCYLSFRLILNDRLALDLLPYVWKIRGNFYYVYCFLSDVKACALHTVQFPNRDSCKEDSDFDETECQICMDKKKQVVLPAQKNTCPICRCKIECSEGSDLWQLTSHEIKDIGSYATDLVARIFEFLDKRQRSEYTEDQIARSSELYATASALKYTPLNKLSARELLPTTLPLGLSTMLGRSTAAPPTTEPDSDFLLALELASGEDQFAAFRRIEQMRRDQVLAMALAMEVQDENDDDPSEL
ncbi:hypothetical protein P43SY_002378 [Pythium insidiosum]|uniref:Uncharacterized protein n=1 Tax=Pythium insidiosum TaxID=114742 RepID=A0AAD5LTP1_PYTIN|nr:hypothetical protein P43SY_002378 [Pythium insidiosum]KAJ0412205.1 hypothetical protein ATCC90586_005818 [Pythium insidiosum]